MNNKTKKLALAVLATAVLSGCSSMQVAELSRAGAVPAQAEETKVMRPLPGYGSMGGYRYRRFAAVAG
jgi:uncharacterized protein YceK